MFDQRKIIPMSEINNSKKTINLFQCGYDESILSTHIEESILIVTTTKRVVAIEVPE